MACHIFLPNGGSFWEMEDRLGHKQTQSVVLECGQFHGKASLASESQFLL